MVRLGDPVFVEPSGVVVRVSYFPTPDTVLTVGTPLYGATHARLIERIPLEIVRVVVSETTDYAILRLPTGVVGVNTYPALPLPLKSGNEVFIPLNGALYAGKVEDVPYTGLTGTGRYNNGKVACCFEGLTDSRGQTGLPLLVRHNQSYAVVGHLYGCSRPWLLFTPIVHWMEDGGRDPAELVSWVECILNVLPTTYYDPEH